MNDMYHISAERQRRKYGLVSNYLYYMKCMKEWDKRLFFSQVFVTLPTVAAALLGTILPSALVNGLETRLDAGTLLLQVACIALAMWLCNLAAVSMSKYSYEQYEFLPLYYAEKYVRKIMDVDYELLDDKHFRHISENVYGTARYGRGIADASYIFPEFTINLFGAVLYGILIGKEKLLLLFVTMVSLGISLLLLSIARKQHRKYFGNISKYAKREDYITMMSMDSSAGKDIRIYRMLDWFLKKYDASLKEIGKLYAGIHSWYTFRNVSSALLEFLRDGLSFTFLIYLFVNGSITASGFVFYIGLISGFSLYFEAVLRTIMEFNSVNTSISYVREFLETESEWKNTEGISSQELEKLRQNPVTLTLEHVSFTYPGNEEPTLKDISLTVRPGEKLALLGLNGAGKTTLVKLICGLYQPNEGRILLNGIPVRQFNREDYYSLISVLFQDSTLLPLSVDENITGLTKKDRVDSQRLLSSLKLSGFYDRYRLLAKGGDTRLVKKVSEDAVDFSGGEQQKMLFARSLYKDAPLVILDEPTAALDPIAENELYQNYGNAMENRTSIYISHRLSSTRFCDRIVLLEHGRLIEEGTHESLLAANSRYAQLYEMQSQYYKDQAALKKRSELMDDEYVQDHEAERSVFNE